jgi:2-oxoglutarate ferredoxin oxidoreductase subunit beta
MSAPPQIKTIKRRANDYKSDIKPIWCPGCGDYGFIAAFYRALVELGLPPEKVAIASGIGCSGRFPAFARVYGYHGVHGRALPLATGIKLGNPELTVFAVGGDGDAFSIGGGHLAHAAARNTDITYIVLDNRIYGLTKGQPSPTTPTGHRTKASPYGKMGKQMNPIATMLAYYSSFVARGSATAPRQLTELIIQAVEHPGFSFIHVLSPCVSFHDTYPLVKGQSTPVPEEHDISDHEAASALTLERGKLYMGVFYQEDYAGLVEEMETLSHQAREDDYTTQDLVNQYRL